MVDNVTQTVTSSSIPQETVKDDLMPVSTKYSWAPMKDEGAVANIICESPILAAGVT